MRTSSLVPLARIAQRSSSAALRPASRPLTTSTVRMSEKYGVKQSGSGGMSGATQTPANSGLGHTKPKAMDADGAIGKQFTADGAIGGMAQKVGGPFDKEGAIGKQFTTEGSIGGTVQENMGGKANKSN